MNGIQRRLGSLTLVFLVGLGLFGCGKTEDVKSAREAQKSAELDAGDAGGEDLSTPEKTLEALKAAETNRDYPKVCQYFTPDAQHALAGGLLLAGKFLKAVINSQAQGTSEKDKQVVSGIDELLKQYHLEADLDVKLDADPKNDQDELLRVGKKISDPCQFVVDFIKTMREHGDQPDSRMIVENAKLENLKTKGDDSQGELVFMRGESEKRSPIGFQKVNGQWKISTIPDVLFK